MSVTNPQQSLAGRHAVITGAGRGIGAAIAASLALQGVRLSLLGRQRTTLEDTARALGANRETCIATVDVSQPEEVKCAFASCRAVLGPVHILINNAGQAQSASFQQTDMALWERMLAVNLTGSYLCAREALPDMFAAGFGRVVNVASVAGLAGAPYISAYCAAKHGVIGLTRALALEVAERNITVNAVCPGYTETDLLKTAVENIQAKTGRSTADILAGLAARNPQRRLMQPQEVADTVTWLCLPGAAGITAQSIVVAGGEVTG